MAKRPLRMRAEILEHREGGLMAGEARDSHALTARQALAQRSFGGNFIDATDGNLRHGQPASRAACSMASSTSA